MATLKVSNSIINVGIDVGKTFLDIHIYKKEIYWQDENTPEGIYGFQLRCQLVNRPVRTRMQGGVRAGG